MGVGSLLPGRKFIAFVKRGPRKSSLSPSPENRRVVKEETNALIKDQLFEYDYIRHVDSDTQQT